MTKEILTLINGNGQKYKRELPLIYHIGFINNVALKYIEERTGLKFKKDWGNTFTAQPTKSSQIVALILTYNFKTQYHDNASIHNTLFIKSDYNVGFNVDSICFNCCKRNNIHISGLKKGEFLSC